MGRICRFFFESGQHGVAHLGQIDSVFGKQGVDAVGQRPCRYSKSKQVLLLFQQFLKIERTRRSEVFQTQGIALDKLPQPLFVAGLNKGASDRVLDKRLHNPCIPAVSCKGGKVFQGRKHS